MNKPSVSGARTGTGGVAGIVSGSMSECRVTGGTVAGTGFLGGVVGEVHGGMNNCSAVGTTVHIMGDNSPAGGVAGNILDADASNLYFSGLITYANLQNDNGQIIGGVVGTLQNVALRNSFSSGVVRGYRLTVASRRSCRHSVKRSCRELLLLRSGSLLHKDGRRYNRSDTGSDRQK